MFLCLKCNIEYDAPTRGKHFVFQSQMHMKAFLSEHPFYIQLLSSLNIVLHIYNLNWGFNVGVIINTSLLNSILLSWVFLNIVLHICNLNCEFIDTNLLNSPLLSWDGILDKRNI